MVSALVFSGETASNSLGRSEWVGHQEKPSAALIKVSIQGFHDVC
jgi:hypothetical protein